MQLLRAIVVVVALGAAALQYLQEWRRLQAVQRLPAEQARALYEAARRRSDRSLLVFTAVMAVAGAAAAAYLAGWLG
jgi:ferric-dicitrate binding protein FerR (iron transport regulator)